MIRIAQNPVSVYSHPYRPELAMLRVWLNHEGYHPSAVERIVSYAAEEGTLEGLVDQGWLEPADYEYATDLFTMGMEPVPHVSAEWDDPGIWIDLDSYEQAIERYARLHGPDEFGDFPRVASAADKAQAAAEMVAWFAEHPEG